VVARSSGFVSQVESVAPAVVAVMRQNWLSSRAARRLPALPSSYRKHRCHWHSVLPQPTRTSLMRRCGFN